MSSFISILRRLVPRFFGKNTACTNSSVEDPDANMDKFDLKVSALASVPLKESIRNHFLSLHCVGLEKRVLNWNLCKSMTCLTYLKSNEAHFSMFKFFLRVLLFWFSNTLKTQLSSQKRQRASRTMSPSPMAGRFKTLKIPDIRKLLAHFSPIGSENGESKQW